MAEAKINNSIGNIEKNTKNPFNKTFEKVVGRTIDSIDIYQSHTETSLTPEFKFCIMNISKDGEDGKKALSILEKSAAEGSTEAMYFLGQHYHLHKKDDEKAIFWHTMAAENGHTRSQLCLAYLLIEKKEYEKAIEYLKKADENEKAKSEVMYIMSHLYLDGKGVSKDEEKAITLLKESAKLDHTAALFELGHYYISIKDFKNALENYKKSADLGDTCGAYNYAVCYVNGEGVKKNTKKAFEILGRFIGKYGERTMLVDLLKKIESMEQTPDTKSEETDTNEATYKIANRVYLNPISKWPSLIAGILGCVIGLAMLFVAIFVVKQVAAYALCAMFIALGIINFWFLFVIKQKNEENTKNQTYPTEAVLFKDDEFIFVTDKLTFIKLNEIKKITFKKDMFRTNLAIGAIIVETENATTYKVSNVNNIYEVVSTMNQILNEYLHKNNA